MKIFKRPGNCTELIIGTISEWDVWQHGPILYNDLQVKSLTLTQKYNYCSNSKWTFLLKDCNSITDKQPVPNSSAQIHMPNQ